MVVNEKTDGHKASVDVYVNVNCTATDGIRTNVLF